MGAKWMDVLHEAVNAVVEVLAHQRNWGHSGQRSGQYAFDLTADAAAVSVLHAGGLRVLSEESGLSCPDPDAEPEIPSDGIVAVIDPVDGSTNASRGVRYFATSICVVNSGVPVVAVVHDHGTGERYEAAKGRGAFLDKVRLTAGSAPPHLEDALIAVNGMPTGHGGWAQTRALGAAALELCYVADRRFDGYIDFSPGGLSPWDYLGALLVCQEAGVDVRDSKGRDLVALDHKSRRSLVAAPVPLVGGLMKVRGALAAAQP